MDQIDNLNHNFIKVEVEVKTETIIRGIIKIDSDKITDQIAETEDNTNMTEIGLDMNQDMNKDMSKIIEDVILEGM